MNVKELKEYCTEKIGAGDAEILQNFMQKQHKASGKTIVCNAAVLLGIALGLTLIISALSGKFSLELVKNMIPFYLFFLFFFIVLSLGVMIKSSRVSSRLKRAVKEESGITASRQNYVLQEISTERFTKGNGDSETSTFYHFSGEDDASENFIVGSGQTGCCYDEIAKKERYKLYCIQEKYIFFIKNFSE